MSEPSKPKQRELAADNEHIAAFIELCRWWLPFISARDLHLVLTTLHLTLGRKMKSAHYHISDIIDGCRAGDRIIHHGSTLSRSSVFRSMKSLKASGLLTIKQDHRAGYIFQLNSDWRPENFEEEVAQRVQFFARRRRKPYERVEYLWQPAQPHFHIRAARLLCDQWLRRLSAPEIKVMLMLTECTFGHRKTECHLTVEELRYGIRSQKDGGMWNMGTGLSLRTIFDALASLENRGAIFRRKGYGSGYILAINTGEWHNVATDPAPEEVPSPSPDIATEECDVAPEALVIPVASAANWTLDHCNPDTEQLQTGHSSYNRQEPQLTNTAIDTIVRRSAPNASSPAKNLNQFTGKNACKSPHGLLPPAEKPHTPQPPAPRVISPIPPQPVPSSPPPLLAPDDMGHRPITNVVPLRRIQRQARPSPGRAYAPAPDDDPHGAAYSREFAHGDGCPEDFDAPMPSFNVQGEHVVWGSLREGDEA